MYELLLLLSSCLNSPCIEREFVTADSGNDILMEIPVPFYIDASDVHVNIGVDRLQVSVRNTLAFSRTYWKHRYATCESFVCHLQLQRQSAQQFKSCCEAWL